MDQNQSHQLHDNDRGTMTAPQRRAFAELLKGPFISFDRTPEVFTTISLNRGLFEQALDNLFLTLIVDDVAGIAYAKSWDEDLAEGESRTLMRRKSLTFAESVILLQLRHDLMKESPSERVVVSENEVFERCLPFFTSMGTDKAASEKKFNAAWNKLKEVSIIRAVPAMEDRFEISPVLRLIFSAEEIAQLEANYTQLLEDRND